MTMAEPTRLQRKAALRVVRLTADADADTVEGARMRESFLGSEYKRFMTSPASQNRKITAARTIAQKRRAR
jgi:hypothetical protein